MAVNTINAQMLQKMFLAGAGRIEAKKEWINELNVFPVPDGDTGTNMSMTIMSAAREVEQIENPTMETLARAISMGALRGARGNSGVILSQLFRGFTKKIKDKEEIDLAILASAFCKAADTAYKAVMKPKEGTILTVARGMADKAADIALETEDLAQAMEMIIQEGEAVLARTPDMLPVLKQAGVVDSGGQGLMEVLKGAVDCFMGRETVIIPTTSGKSASAVNVPSDIDTADIKFGYCTEFIIMLEKSFSQTDENQFKAFLESIGDSIVCVNDEDIVKVHVHTNDPGLAIQKGLSFGSLTSMKIDNMREEHHERLIKDAQKLAAKQAEEANNPQVDLGPEKEYGFIVVSIGRGMNEIFRGLGADSIIEGGQTMNPSTEDILRAVESVNAKTVFILPNNKNIILAAEQAKMLVENKQVMVIPSTTIPQGIAAMINYIDGDSAEDNLAHMTEEMGNVRSGQLTYAVRDTELDGKVIKEGDIMGIGDKGIEAVGQDIEATAIELVGALAEDEAELISIYYGEDVKEADAIALSEKLQEMYSDCDIELQYGGQPIYYYVLSVE